MEDLAVGQTQEQVRQSFGKPTDSQEFVIPDGPYFGASEGLIEILSAGTLVEEWQYKMGDEIKNVILSN